MKSTHMSKWEQEEYVLGRRTRNPSMEDGSTRQIAVHLAQCGACRAEVEQLDQGLALFQSSAIAWSAACLETRAQNPRARMPAHSTGSLFYWSRLQWAMASILLMIVLLPLSYLAMHRPSPVAKTGPATPALSPASSDDALLQQVDQQVSVEVPDSMESLTHLVTDDNPADASAQAAYAEESRGHVQRN